MERPEELRARTVIERELGCAVDLHDLGGHSQFDYTLSFADGRRGALEVTQALDPIWMSQLAAVRRRFPISYTGNQCWLVEIEAGGNVKRLRKVLSGNLLDVERQGRRHVPAGEIQDVSEAHAFESTENEGRIFVEPEGAPGGWVELDPLPAWISEYLATPARDDVVDKLRSADADEKHAFVWVTTNAVSTATLLFPLTLGDRPQQEPVLPNGISNVWVVPAFSPAVGWRWSADGSWSKLAPI